MALFSHIMCCTDLSERSLTAFKAAVELARTHGARLSLLHVVVPHTTLLPGLPRPGHEMDDQEIVELLEDHLRREYLSLAPELDCRIWLRRGHPSVEILNQLEESDVDLVVLGSEGLSGMGLVILGSVAERVLRRAKVSCLVYR